MSDFRRSTILVLLLVLAVTGLHAQSYTIVDLGTLGGHASGSDGLNDLGETVGWGIVDSGAYYGFISSRDGTSLESLGSPPNGTYSYSQGVNDLGQVVGYGEVFVGFGKEDRAFLWDSGVMTELGTLGGDASQAWAINGAGQIVGWAEDGGPGQQAFLWENGAMVALPGFTGGYPDSEARDINEQGVVVGYAWDSADIRQAVVWENGGLARVLGMPADAGGARAYAVNELGEAAGNVWGGPGGVKTAVFWEADGTPVLLPPTASHYYNIAYGLNDAGQAVGQSYSGGHSGGSGGPVLWENGIAFELEDIVEPRTGIFGFVVSDINAEGQIAATGSASGGFRALRLDPVPGGLGMSGPDPGYVARENRLAVRGGTPGARMFFFIGLHEGASPVPRCAGEALAMANPRFVGQAVVDGNGHAVLDREIPESLGGRSVLFQAVEGASCRVTNRTSHRFF